MAVQLRTLGICGEVEDISVTAGSEHHRVGNMRFDFSSDQVSNDDTACLAVNDDTSSISVRGYIFTLPRPI